jgi:SAM-dependent methyltransferase
MVSFAPLKKYVLQVMDELIDAHGLEGPFLDAGCGRGDVAQHLAQRGWEGMAIDFSPEAVQVAQKNLQGYPVQAQVGNLMEITREFRTIVSCTVIEHVKDDAALLRQFRRCMPRGGGLILSMPTNPACEWRWDDDYYGHYRRYEKDKLQHLLADCGFEMLELCDYTFPVFWAMRRVYVRLFPVKKPLSAIPEENTAMSSLRDAFEMGPLARIVAALPVWGLVFALQRPFRHGGRGFEAILVARAI